jgi:hypothetical protein
VDVLRASKTKKRVKCQVIVSTLPCCTEAFEAGAEQYEQHKAEQFTGTCFLCKGELAHGTSHSPDPEAYSDKYADQCEYCEEDYSYCKHDPVWAEEEAARVKADLRYLEALWDM